MRGRHSRDPLPLWVFDASFKSALGSWRDGGSEETSIQPLNFLTFKVIEAYWTNKIVDKDVCASQESFAWSRAHGCMVLTSAVREGE